MKGNSFPLIHIKLVKMLRKYHLLVSISIVNSQGFGVVISMKKKINKIPLMESCRTKLVIILQTQISCIRRYVRNITNKLLVIIRSLRVGFAGFQNLAPWNNFCCKAYFTSFNAKLYICKILLKLFSEMSNMSHKKLAIAVFPIWKAKFYGLLVQ